MADNDCTMKQCIRCLVDKPATTEYFQHDKNRKDGFNPYCKTCCKEYKDTHKEQSAAKFKEWRERNQEYSIERTRQWRIDNSDYHHQWYLDHAEVTKIRGRKWREDHPDRVKQRGKTYREKHPFRVSVWRNQNPEKIRVISSRRRSRKHSLPKNLTHDEWQQTLNHFKGCCAVCGRPQGLWHIIAMDHWIPLSADVLDNPGTVRWNVLPLCHGVDGCNNEKRSTMPQAWLQKKFGKRKGNQVYAEIQQYLEGLKDD